MNSMANMRAILLEPGKSPSILELPVEGLKHEEAIRDTLGGNYGAVEFFQIAEGISLFILVNDLAATLGLKPNRRFPEEDREHIIFGNAIFIAAYNGETEGQEGTLDMPEDLCKVFIEQIEKAFEACDGTESPRPEDTLYYDEPEGKNPPKAYRWIEISKPENLGEPMEAGRVNFYGEGHREFMEASGRFCRRTEVYTKDSPLH